MPKDVSVSSTGSKAARRLLRDVALRELYKRLKSESKSTRTHTLTTEELTKLLDNARRHTDLPDVTAETAAEAAKQRQLDLTKKRVETLERLHIAQRPTPTPVASSSKKQPLDDFKRTDIEDHKKILAAKLSATLKRLGALKEVDEYRFRLDAACDQARKFTLGFQRLEALQLHIDEIVPALTQHEWTQVNWGLTAIGGISFKGLRRNYGHIVRNVSDFCTDYFGFLDIESLV